jgi:hypothetical protein
MEISSKNQLVPYHQVPQQVALYSPEVTRSVPAQHSSAGKRYVLMPPAHSPRHAVQSDDQKAIYTSNRRIKTDENSQVGRRINIYT